MMTTDVREYLPYIIILQTKVDEKTNLSLEPLSDIEEVDIL